jgi:hypothetical protein
MLPLPVPVEECVMRLLKSGIRSSPTLVTCIQSWIEFPMGSGCVFRSLHVSKSATGCEYCG